MPLFLDIPKFLFPRNSSWLVVSDDVWYVASYYVDQICFWHTIIVITFVFGVVSIEVWPTKMPIWALVLALLVGFLYTVPIGIIQAITNQQIGLNVVTELIVGYALPGRPIAMMLFKVQLLPVSLFIWIIYWPASHRLGGILWVHNFELLLMELMLILLC